MYKDDIKEYHLEQREMFQYTNVRTVGASLILGQLLRLTVKHLLAYGWLLLKQIKLHNSNVLHRCFCKRNKITMTNDQHIEFYSEMVYFVQMV